MMLTGPSSAIALLLLAPNAVSAAFIPVTWNICGAELTNGASVTGSFVFDANIQAPMPPYTNINIQSGLNYRHVIANSPGNDSFLLALADPEPQQGASVLNYPNIGLMFAQPLTDQGGTVMINTAATFAGLGTCATSTCSSSTPGVRLAQNSPFVTTGACPTVTDPDPEDPEEDDDEGCEGPSDFFSFFSWLFCIAFEFIGSLFSS